MARHGFPPNHTLGGLNVAVWPIGPIAGVATIVMGWDSSILTRLSLGGTNRLEQSLITRLQPVAPSTGRNVTMVISASTATGESGKAS